MKKREKRGSNERTRINLENRDIGKYFIVVINEEFIKMLENIELK